MKNLRKFFSIAAVSGLAAFSPVARVVSATALAGLAGGLVLTTVTETEAQAADASPQAFVEREQGKLSALLKQPASAAREAQITAELETMVDYQVLAQRSFGEPCPVGVAACANHWKDLTAEQRTEVTDLLKRLVQKNYKKNLTKTVDYDMTYKASVESGGDTKVRTQAKSKLNAREAPISVDYIVNGNGGSYHVVDIVTEGSSVSKNYYNQFHKMLTTPDQGYAYVVKKLKEKLAK